MRDDRNKWPAAMGADRANLVVQGVELSLVKLARQTVISGAVADCLALCEMQAATGGGADIATGPAYALRQRRDRLLVVNGPPIEEGWHASQAVAVCDMSSAYHVISLSGTLVDQVIATGTEMTPGAVSASVSRLWHGFGMLLYRYETADSYRIHVRSAQLEAVWDMLERQISALAPVWAMEPPPVGAHDALDAQGTSGGSGNDNTKPDHRKAS